MQSSKQDSRRKLTLRTAMLKRLQAGVVGEAVVLVSLTSAKTISIRRVALLFSASFLGAAVSMRHGDVALAQAHRAFPVPARARVGFSDPASHVLVLRGRGWCAVLLQTAYRRWRHRAAYIALIRLRNFRATRLAAAWRRYAAFRALPQRRAEHRERELRRAAMIAIQCAARLFCASARDGEAT